MFSQPQGLAWSQAQQGLAFLPGQSRGGRSRVRICCPLLGIAGKLFLSQQCQERTW